VRSRPAPTLAVPLRWVELGSAIPSGWHIDTIADRMADPPPLPVRTRLDVDAVVAAAEDAGIDSDRHHDRFRG